LGAKIPENFKNSGNINFTTNLAIKDIPNRLQLFFIHAVHHSKELYAPQSFTKYFPRGDSRIPPGHVPS
jgi:hypothetical protein